MKTVSTGRCCALQSSAGVN